MRRLSEMLAERDRRYAELREAVDCGAAGASEHERREIEKEADCFRRENQILGDQMRALERTNRELESAAERNSREKESIEFSFSSYSQKVQKNTKLLLENKATLEAKV